MNGSTDLGFKFATEEQTPWRGKEDGAISEIDVCARAHGPQQNAINCID